MKTKEQREMFELKKQGLTLQEIGNRYGVSREYVRKLISSIDGYTELRQTGLGNRVERCDFICEQCGEKSKRLPGSVKNRKFCSMDCYVASKGKKRVYISSMTEEERKKYHADRARKYYNSILKHKPGFKERVAQYNKKAQQTEWYKESIKRRYLKMRNNPVRWAEYLKKLRDRKKRKND